MTVAPAPTGLTLGLEVPAKLVEAVAKRAAEMIAEGTKQDAGGWLDAKGAAEYLGLPLSMVRKLSAAREIPCVQDVPKGKLYFKRSALDEWRAS